MSRLARALSVVNRHALLGLLAALLLVACDRADDGAERPTPRTGPQAAADQCGDDYVLAHRKLFLDRVGAPPLPAGLPHPVEGEARDGGSWQAQALSWEHPTVKGDSVHAVVHRPSPTPSAPAPLLLNVHGHWDAGVEADEVVRRAQLFASRGWVVLSIASRGDEKGDASPGVRAVHLRQGVYGEMRIRRTGTTPLAWDLRAQQAGLAIALAGRLGVSIDADAVAVMGFSGGAERAVLLGTADPRVGAVVIGAHEYAFTSGRGGVGCSCGVVPGAGDSAGRPGTWPDVGDRPTRIPAGGPLMGWHWLAGAACRPGAPPRSRPVLVWDNRPEDVVDAVLKQRPDVTVFEVPEVHGVTSEMAARSWLWLEKTLRGRDVQEGDADAARAAVDAAYPGPGTPKTSLTSLPAPGSLQHGRPPTGARAPAPLQAARAVLRADRGGIVRSVFGPLAGAPTTVEGPIRPAWLRFAPPSPTRAMDSEGEVVFVVPPVEDPPTGGVRDVLVPLARDAASDRAASRWGAETGVPALAYMVRQLLDARDGASGSPGWVGVGAGAVAVAWAAALDGGTSPVVLVDAPVTLWARGPMEADLAPGVPWLPWPSWTLAPVPAGMALDPWQAARSLKDRVRWVRPRSGDGSPWKGPLPGGERYESLAEATQ